MGMITNINNNEWKINGTIWQNLMEDALKYPTRTYAELKIPYSFELDNITDDYVEKIKEIIYDLRNDPSRIYTAWNTGLHLGMIGITGSSMPDDDVLRIECSGYGHIGLGSPCPSAKLHIESDDEVLRIECTGNIGLGSDINPSAKLHVVENTGTYTLNNDNSDNSEWSISYGEGS